MDYTLQYTNNYDNYYGAEWDPSKCGAPGVRYGLLTQFSETDLKHIPYKELIEIPIAFGGGGNGAGIINLCETFKDIELQIMATCEIPTSNSQVYQYGIDPSTSAVSYDPARRLYAANSTAKFSVSWNNAKGKRALGEVSEESELGMMRTEMSEMKQEMKQELEVKFDAVETKMDGLRSVIASLVNELSSDKRHAGGYDSGTKSLWEQLHTEKWLLDPGSTSHTLKDLGVETEDDLALLDKSQLEQLAELFKPIPKKKFLSALF